MATRKSGSQRASTSRRKPSTSSRKRKAFAAASAEAARAIPAITAGERRKMAQQEAKWQAESDLRTLRQAEEIRRDSTRLQRASRVAAEEMQALQAVRALRPQKR